MSSVEALAHWLRERPKQNGTASVVHQIRLDQDSSKSLAYLAQRFGMPKATLAQELLRAAIKDTLVATPGNKTIEEVMGHHVSEEEIVEMGYNLGQLVHDMSGVRDSVEGEG